MSERDMRVVRLGEISHLPSAHVADVPVTLGSRLLYMLLHNRFEPLDALAGPVPLSWSSDIHHIAQTGLYGSLPNGCLEHCRSLDSGRATGMPLLARWDSLSAIIAVRVGKGHETLNALSGVFYAGGNGYAW